MTGAVRHPTVFWAEVPVPSTSGSRNSRMSSKDVHREQEPSQRESVREAEKPRHQTGLVMRQVSNFSL